MGFKVADRVKETITAAGSGDITLAGSAAKGFQPFASGISNGDYTFYVIEENDKWEVGYGRFIDNKLTRDLIFDCSQGGSRIDLAGETSVTITYPAERSVYLNEDLNAVVGSGLIFTNSSQKLNTTSSHLYWDSKKLGYESDIVYVSGMVLSASGVDGTGSANQVAFWSDSNTINGDSNLYWDNTNDRLGIGTASPATRVDIAGTGTLDYIQFDSSITDTDQPTAGMSWNSNAGTVDIGINGGHTMHVGQDVYYRVQNQSGNQIYKGQAVYASGATAGGQRILIDKFVSDSSIQDPRFLGLATEDISHGSTGFVQHFGYVSHVDTRTSNTDINPDGETWLEGDILFAHPTTAGGLTKNKPKEAIYVAMVLDTGNNGELFVRPSDSGHIDDLHDVDTSGLVDNNFLIWNSGADYWEPSTSLTFNNTLYLSGVEIDPRVWGSGLADDFDLDIVNEDISYVSGVASTALDLAIAISGVGHYDYQNIDSDINLTDQDDIIFVDSSNSPVNVYMPLASGIGGKKIIVKWSDGDNTISILPSGTETIDGQSSMTMAHKYQSTTLGSNNSNWFIL